MSYTPENEQIEGLLARCLDDLEYLRERMMNRLRSPDWGSDHKAELRLAVTQVTEVQLTLARLQ